MYITDIVHGFPWDAVEANNCNTYFINGERKILVDPGHTAHFNRIESELSAIGVGLSDIDDIILTHIHPDHFEAAMEFRGFDTQILYHPEEWELVKAMEPWLVQNTDFTLEDVKPDQFLNEGPFPDTGTAMDVIHTPGHTPGSISLYLPEESVIITGDVVFKDGIGRTDLPGGDGNRLKKSINRLADCHAMALLPGHGEIIVGKSEVNANFERIKTYWFSFI